MNQTATYTYDDAGRLVSLVNFNGTVTTYTYDDADRLTGIDSRTSGNAVIATYDYTLDNNGNRVSIDKNIPAAGTLPARNETATYSHNRLTSTDTALYDYDNEGQLSSKQEGGTTTYSFDKAYRLTGIGADTFSYDGAGNRLRAVRSGVEIRYIYDANGNLLAEADGSNTITRYYVHGAGLLAAITPANDLYCYHYDATGNTVAITDASETVVNSYDYSPFGMVISESENFVQPFKYVGKLGVMAEANGFYYMRARYYDPLNGRFISEDPMGFDGGNVNLYVYSGNNPVLLVDPLGLINWGRVGLGTLEAGAGVAGIVAAAYTEVGSVGVATGVAVSLAGFSVPALSHGVSEIIAGFIETNAAIPPVSAPAVATLAVTGDVNQAQTADFIGNSLMLGGNVASWTTNIPNRAAAISAGTSFGGLAGQSTTMGGSRCGN